MDHLIQQMQNFNLSNKLLITETSTQLSLSDQKNFCSFPFWKKPKNLLNKIDLHIEHLQLNAAIKKDALNPEEENCKKKFPLIKSIFTANTKELKKLDIMGLHSMNSSEFLALMDLSQLEVLFISGVKISKLPVHKINLPNLQKVRLSFLENFHIDNFCKLDTKGVDKNLCLKGYSKKNFNLTENGTFSQKAPKNIVYHIDAADHLWIKSPKRPEILPRTLNETVLAEKLQRALQE